MATDYANPGGIGDRSASITVTATGVSGGSSLQQLVDGVRWTPALNVGQNVMAGGLTNGMIKFDFGVGADVVIDSFRAWIIAIHKLGQLSFGTWRWAGSNDDAAYTDLGSPFEIVSGDLGAQSYSVTSVYTGKEYSEPAGNVTGYRYYRLSQVGGVVPTVQNFVGEFEFKINSSEGTPDPDPPPPPTPDYTEPGGDGDRSALIWVSQNFFENL